ncbi:sensor histidine kinase [Cryptosporangium sp. NPDC051539]|uniref:sensor histidine kinase n=1 Tax=Cryptosporangium sp. NPDC051539 TaxID=3363962 RepID=UPI00379A3FCA
MSMRAVLPVPGHTGRAILAGLGTGLLTVVCGAPYWSHHVAGAVVSVVASFAFGAAGGLLAGTGDTRSRSGVLLLVAAVFTAFTWLSIFDVGIFPVFAIFSEGVGITAAGAAVLVYPVGHLTGRAERYWVYAAIEVLVVQEFLVELVSRPQWNGNSADVFWPTLVPDRWLFDRLIPTNIGLQAVLAVWYVALLIRRGRRLSRNERPAMIPVLVATAIVAVAATVTLRTNAWTSLEALMSFYVVQDTVAVVLPLAVLSGALRERWWEVDAPLRVVRMTSASTSVARVREALAHALRDPTLTLLFWVPTEESFVDSAGRLVELPSPEPSRWLIETRTDDHTPLAVIELDGALRGRPALVDAVLRAGSQALLTAQLQAAATAHLQQVHAAQARVEEREIAERQRLENDLRAGAQQQLVALSGQLEQLAADTPLDSVRSVAVACHAEVHAALEDLRALAQGLHPPVLRTDGLGPALETVAGRLGLAVDLAVSARRQPPAVEATAYFALCEGLTNVAKYAPDASVRIVITEVDGWLHGLVADDGPGGARVVPGGGLAGITDRTRALHGWAAVESDPGAGTRLRVGLPCG